jgi:Uma2 family endonuclease
MYKRRRHLPAGEEELSMTPTLAPPAAAARTVADLLECLGNVPAERVRLQPPPGRATEADVLAVDAHEDRLCELVDGTLVEKAVGIREAILALALAGYLRAFIVPRNLGLVAGPDGAIRLFAGSVRIPDVAFISWDRCPGRRVPTAPIPQIAPDLVVEVLSESNTLAEMARKRGEYFGAGVRLVWEIDPEARTATVYTAADLSTVLDQTQALDGGAVLPGFTLPLADLFAELDRHGNP